MPAKLALYRRLGFALACVVLGNASSAFAEEPLEFNRDIRPILSNHCLACHGFDAKQRKGELRLDVAESALADRGGSFAIKPGDLAASEVWARLNSTDENTVMPPPAANKPLTAEQKDLLRRWIEQGAPYQRHWAFEPPIRRPEPAVQNQAWPKTGIDRFLLQRLEREGLAPQPEADRETLIRRVAFALTGLPPTVQEVDAFLADASPTAYEALVDRYLQSPRYGEEMARHWLDVARYADTHGLHLDNERLMWSYRDWVIEAFNDNLPFDRFTVSQLAGDLLPNPSLDQLVATGFNRCNVTTSEGGAINEEFLYRYAVDRTSTMVQAWMGLTGGCSVCHDHKYDPLTMKEFYSLYAFFYSAADPAMDRNVFDTDPFLKVPTAEQQQGLAVATAREQLAREQLEQAAAAAVAMYVDPADKPSSFKQPSTRVLFDEFFPAGASVRNTSRNPSTWEADPPFGAPSGRRVLRQANSHFTEEVFESKLRPVSIPGNGQLDVWLRLSAASAPQAVAVILNAGTGARRVVWGGPEAFDADPASYSKDVHKGPLPATGQWTRLTVSLADLELTEGQRLASLTLQQAGGLVWWDAPTLLGETDPATDPATSFMAWWKMDAGSNPPDVPADLQAVLKDGPDKAPAPELRQKLLAFYLGHAGRTATDDLAEKRRAFDSSRAARLAIDDAIAGTMIFKELPQPREAFVMMRGQYDKPGEKVEPGVPGVFPPLQKGSAEARATRLDLARWLTSAEHPLTARVQVNRFWQQLFGTGLVKTSYDFGSQGDLPSHPELLDYLAVQFRESGWDVKGLVRQLVLSAAFRQQSGAPPEVRQRDPENRLYARGPRLRLEAEQIRDNALAVSGLVNLQMGGPGVRPYQPPNIWEPVGYGDSNTRYYLQDHGAALYRRSVYCFLKRTAPPPFMSNFDGPNREQFCVRRERSNTPLQALHLLNDVQHFEAARALAERAIAEGGATPEDKIAFLFRTVLARRPAAEETALLKDAQAAQQALFAGDPQAAAKAIRVGESLPKGAAPEPETAAWTIVANLILNLDETVTRN